MKSHRFWGFWIEVVRNIAPYMITVVKERFIFLYRLESKIQGQALSRHLDVVGKCHLCETGFLHYVPWGLRSKWQRTEWTL